MRKSRLLIGWSSVDLTPEKPVVLRGQFHARVSEGVMDPITATVLAMESGEGEHVILASCDFVSITDVFRDGVREAVARLRPGIKPERVCLNATHTHAGPELSKGDEPLRKQRESEEFRFGLSAEDIGAMNPAEYTSDAIEALAEAIAEAWDARESGGVGFGLGCAVVGRNRRVAFLSGESRMYASPDNPEFSHIEGYEDHDVNYLCTFDENERLTGIMLNVACPSQVSEQEYRLSADYWHETRLELRARFGEDLFVLPQCGAAGDQSPHVLLNQRAEARMLALKARTDESPAAGVNSNLAAPMALRREIANRLADAVEAGMPEVRKDIRFETEFGFKRVETRLALRKLTQADVDDALASAEEYRVKYEAERAALDANPRKREEPRWYRDITMYNSRMNWFLGVRTRFERQGSGTGAPVELYLLRLGDVAITTSPFELYTDFGIRIKARSPAVQTFVVQLAGSGTYLPTERAMAGGSYGAVPASTPIGPEGGQQVVEESLAGLGELWSE